MEDKNREKKEEGVHEDQRRNLDDEPDWSKEPLIPTCESCGKPMTHCRCSHNNLIK